MRRRLVRAAATASARLHPSSPAAGALRVARSLAGGSPLVMGPAADRVLVIAPHPDDETIGAGASLASLADTGSTIHVVVATAGEASVAVPDAGTVDTAAARRAEAAAACSLLGALPPTFLDLPDGAVSDERARLRRHLEALLAEVDPQVVFVPWPLDDHPDHRAVAAGFAEAASKPGVLSPGTEIWAYEVWAPLPANRIVDASPWWERKRAALACHTSASGTFDPDAHLALGRWRSIFGLGGHGFAEAFWVCSPAEFARVAAGSGAPATAGGPS